MTTYGPKNPQIINAPAWTNPDDAKVSDGNPAGNLNIVLNGPSDPMDATKFQLGVVEGAGRPPKLTLTINRQADGPGIKDEQVQLLLDGSIIGPNKASASEWSQSGEIVTYIWDAPSPPSRAQMNQDTFGVRIVARGTTENPQTAFIDGITLQAN